ncbi:MAG TPA: efflux RND transporter periplasmic adaptor subunit, partial [bacterium]|nr:efflux RND transporter periplasmic adaptor subunit [bacterium]
MKLIIKNIKENYKLVIVVLITGILLGWLMFHSSEDIAPTKETTEIHDEQDHEEETTTWTCSMHPQIKQDHPGDCPICGMDLVPLSSMDSEGDDFDPNEVMLTESAAKLADIQTTKVMKGNPEKEIYLQGKVAVDERNMAELTARFGGRIEKLYVNFTGEKVNRGEPLATIYSPELVSAQRELIEALAIKESRPTIYQAARAKLSLWDLTEEQIVQIEQEGEPKLYFDVLSPISGTVMKRQVTLGDYVKIGDPLFRVVDLST